MEKKNFDDFILKQLKAIQNHDRISSADIPNIDLYMDQVTTFMNEHLGLFKRSSEDKILTKTMINNYSKYNLLPPTIKKKYTNDHVILMLFIYYLKPILSIGDIKELLAPIQDMFMSENTTKPEGFNDLKELHDAIIETEAVHFSLFKDHTMETANIAKELFKDVKDEKQRKLLSIFATSYLFTVQASAQKHMITSLIDDYLKEDTPPKGKKKS
jgi:hypothetical protein